MNKEELLKRKVEIEESNTCPNNLDCTKCDTKCEPMIEYESILKQLEEKDNYKTWVIADPHFGHKNILVYENRPFVDLEDMAKELIKNWNSCVGKNDTVYVLGDFTLTRRKDYIKSILDQLNGKKVLVMGNHDTLKPNQYIELGFVTAIRKPIMVKPNVLLMHEPPNDNDILKGMTYIFGHVHSKHCNADDYPNCYCVSVERIGYKPIELDKVLKIIDNKLGTKVGK